ncbi:MAG: metal-dependent hydrolase family protein [Candidatus Acidiferrales bacterium]
MRTVKCMTKLGVAVATILFATVPAAAQQPPSGKTIVIRAARMWDGKSDTVTMPGVVVVSGGKIQAAGAAAQIPAGAEVIDLGDATLLPGLMDAHVHLTGEGTDDWKQSYIDFQRKPVAEQAIEATAYARITLMAGFTTVRDLGSGEQIDVGLRNAIRNGKIPGPRMLVTVHALGATGGHCDQAGHRQGLFPESGVRDGIANSPWEMRAAVRLNHKYGADVVKVCATGGVLSLTDAVDTPQLTQEELNAMVDEAHALRMKTAAHAHGAEGAKRAIRAGIDSIDHGTFLDDEALDLMKQRGTFLVPTLMAAQGLRERMARAPNAFPPPILEKAKVAAAALDATVRKAIQKGVKIALGTDAAVYPHGRNAEELSELVRLGMNPMDALRAATSIDAELLGVADRLGSLEAGKIADVIATPGDPSRDIAVTQKVFFVMKNGTVYRNDRAPK